MSFQRLPHSTLSHGATLFGKVAEHCNHLGLGVAKAKILAKWSYVSNCQGLGVSHT